MEKKTLIEKLLSLPEEVTEVVIADSDSEGSQVMHITDVDTIDGETTDGKQTEIGIIFIKR